MNTVQNVVTDVTAVVEPSNDLISQDSGLSPHDGHNRADGAVPADQALAEEPGGSEGVTQQPAKTLLEIKPDLRELISPLLPEELQVLEADICRREGRNRLWVWAGHDIILAGHYCYEICQKHQIPFSIVWIDLPDEAAAKVWILDHHAYHNQTDDQRALSAAVRLKIVIKAPRKNNVSKFHDAAMGTWTTARWRRCCGRPATACRPIARPAKGRRIRTATPSLSTSGGR
jgi:hypothetical protein